MTDDERLQALEEQVTKMTSYLVRVTGFLSSVYVTLPMQQRTELRQDFADLVAGLRDMVDPDERV